MIKTWVLLLILTLVTPTPGLACECHANDFAAVASSADFVVLARIGKIREFKSGSWTMKLDVTRVVRGPIPQGDIVVGGLGTSCEWGSGEFTVAGGKDREWVFALDRKALMKGRYFLWLCSRQWARIKTAELGGDYTVAEVEQLALQRSAE